MFYGSPGDGDSNYEKREAIILKELSKKFKGNSYLQLMMCRKQKI